MFVYVRCGRAPTVQRSILSPACIPVCAISFCLAVCVSLSLFSRSARWPCDIMASKISAHQSPPSTSICTNNILPKDKKKIFTSWTFLIMNIKSIKKNKLVFQLSVAFKVLDTLSERFNARRRTCRRHEIDWRLWQAAVAPAGQPLQRGFIAIIAEINVITKCSLPSPSPPPPPSVRVSAAALHPP